MDMIYLTGLPRSGTTWAGRAIAAGTNSMLIEEPFNWEWHSDRLEYAMKYVPQGSAESGIVRVLRAEMHPLKHPRRFLRLLLHQRILVRDVHTPLAIEHIWEYFRPAIILMVRHPCAVAYSWVRVGFDVSSRLKHLVEQPGLLRDHLKPFRSHLESRADFYSQMGAYWGAVYYVLGRYAENHPEWKWVTHEALSFGGLAEYNDILRALNLKMGTNGKSFLRQHNRPPHKSDNPFSIKRISAQEPDKWVKVLTNENINSVLSGCAPFGVMDKFYPGMPKESSYN